ncbi:alpha/beta hydrolase [Coraliomargarita sinensis]|uniref:Alpha/beta hydrolase n=1 Tax=Coraliomargarita sinensis TaxID=2174842 RepID=A0A317ZLV0_9BACT|nr:alpha/beta fold hydrolase [Coraliomargarita sinensis]PXA05147.1 alpha/beta hydrolase [Coraliomargarita sinensis]
MLKEQTFTNRHGERLDVSFHPGDRTGFLVILGHGVTGDKDRPIVVAVAEGLAARGWPCLRVSFAGNGGSGGDFRASTISKETEDLQDLIGQLPENIRLAYCGHSMGGAVGVLAASKDPRIEVVVNLAGMIRTADFCEREFGEVTPGEGTMWDEPDCPLSQEYVDDLNSIGDLLEEVSVLAKPLLLIHGTADDVVLPEDSKDAYKLAAKPKQLVLIDGAEHCFDEASYPKVVDATAKWLEQHLSD